MKFLILLLLCTSCYTTGWFNRKPILEQPLAAPINTDSGLVYRTKQGLEGHLGKSLVIIEGFQHIWDWKAFYQLGLEGSTWLTLGYSKGSFPLLTQDFLLAVPIMFSTGPLAIAFKYNHISAHLGDALAKVIEPKIYSRDYLSLDASYLFPTAIGEFKLLYRLGYNHKIIPSFLGRWFTGGDFEFRYPLLDDKSFFAAQDLIWNQDTNTLDSTTSAGLILSKNTMFEPRLLINYYYGSDRRGQIYSNHISTFGIGLLIR